MEPTHTTAGQHQASFSQDFRVDGMSCHHCEQAVTSELSRLEGVASVAVDLAAGTVTVTSTRALDLDDVAAAVDEAGYELVR